MTYDLTDSDGVPDWYLPDPRPEVPPSPSPRGGASPGPVSPSGSGERGQYNDEFAYLVILQREDGKAYGVPDIVRAETGPAAVRRKWPHAPTTTRVFRALWFKLDEPRDQGALTIEVAKPEWGEAMRLGRW